MVSAAAQLIVPEFAIVGIGASAGGLDAFHSFFENMPADCGMAFIVILHLPADRKSMLSEILARWTDMRVIEAGDGALIEPNCVYIPPPHSIVTVTEGRLGVRMPGPDEQTGFRPIDALFDSLGTALKDKAVGIVLSGTGSDGALGLKAIKERGGLTVAQGTEGDAPQYGQMPAGAIATGSVDVIAAVEAIPGHLLRVRDSRLSSETPLEESEQQTETARLKMCSILQAQLGHDFSGYRDKTFLRRVHRRMQVANVTTLQQYIQRLQADPDEVVCLFRDLLIRVTSFFRDKETFEALEETVVPRLFANKDANSTVRVWVPGCATGEEAYSLAILLREYMDHVRGEPKVQVFATDIDDSAVATARLGQYPATLLEGLSPGRRERFFQASQGGFVVSREIRDLCTFSTHNLVSDPPFSRMDLVSCRNLLMYMDANLQGAVVPVFHYSLVPGGILLLGVSESAAKHERLFEPLDKAARIFQRRDVPSPPLDITLRRARQVAPRTARIAGLTPRGDDPKSTVGTSSNSVPAPYPSLLLHIRRIFSAFIDRTLRVISPKTLVIEQLQHDLTSTQEELESLAEEHQTALEELRSANEELQSVNEEMQSTNEELETSKATLQALNEKLNTLNAQLSEKLLELDRSNGDLRNLFESTEIATIFLDPHLIIRNFTPAIATLYNLIPSDQGRSLTDIASRLDYDDLAQDVAQVLETLKPLEKRTARSNGSAHYLMRIIPYREPDSRVNGTLVTFVDVTSIVKAEQHQRLLVDELNHRVKNMLTVVLSLATQTLRRCKTLDDFSETFLGRVRALTASYSLLSSQNWLGVSLKEILTEETKPYGMKGGASISMEGPDVKLAPAGALALGMAIHELATNAVKYGALSTPEGMVDIRWHLEPNELVLNWTEQGGPSVTAPKKRGFGTTLIERGFAHELAGRATLNFDAEGIHVSLRAPLETATVAVAPATVAFND